MDLFYTFQLNGEFGGFTLRAKKDPFLTFETFTSSKTLRPNVQHRIVYTESNLLHQRGSVFLWVKGSTDLSVFTSLSSLCVCLHLVVDENYCKSVQSFTCYQTKALLNTQLKCNRVTREKMNSK